MKREIKQVMPKCSDCCPGHDNYPNDAYKNNRSKKQRSFYKAKEHRHSRRTIKQNTKMIDLIEPEPCPGDCNMGLPCQTCGSDGQYIGEIEYE